VRCSRAGEVVGSGEVGGACEVMAFIPPPAGESNVKSVEEVPKSVLTVA
jgi:hypothetical protein